MKIVGKSYYVHKSNVRELNKKLNNIEYNLLCKLLRDAENTLGIIYDVIKYDSGNVTLITSPNWDSCYEPIVGDCYRWKINEWFDNKGIIKQPKVSRNYRQVYHNKWQFVDKNYKGFNIEESKKRTELLNTIPEIVNNKRRIGNRNYWLELLQKYDIII